MTLSVTDSLARLDSLPRVELLSGPTPLQFLPRFSEAVGAEVWMKRDDTGPIGLAGNKVRKYEFVLGEGLERGADTLITTGAAQSNSARAGAAAAAQLGMNCILVLSGDRPEQATANLLLDTLFGADVRFQGDVGWRQLDATVEAIAAELAEAGDQVVVGPIGCSSPLGALGFAAAAVELQGQLDALAMAPSHVYHASSSGGTLAGLVLGTELLATEWTVVAFDVGRLTADPWATALTLAGESAALIGAAPPSGDRASLSMDQMGERYGAVTPAAREAIALLARTEAIVCDPIYSGKALAGLVDDVEHQRRTGPVVFWHTGGHHGLFDPVIAADYFGVS